MTSVRAGARRRSSGSARSTNRTFVLPLVMFYPDQPVQQPLRVVRLVEAQRRRRSEPRGDRASSPASLPALGTRLVVFSGGEPLLRPEVFEAARLFRAQRA